MIDQSIFAAMRTDAENSNKSNQNKSKKVTSTPMQIVYLILDFRS